MKNENIAENKMAKAQIKHLLLRMGLPMIINGAAGAVQRS